MESSSWGSRIFCLLRVRGLGFQALGLRGLEFGLSGCGLDFVPKVLCFGSQLPVNLDGHITRTALVPLKGGMWSLTVGI